MNAKLIFFTLLIVNSLYAQEASAEELSSIYTEALLFIGIFGTMGIISYIYSSKHAKAYKPSKDKLQRIAKEKEVKEKKEARVEALSTMVENELLTQEEFGVLKQFYSKDS